MGGRSNQRILIPESRPRWAPTVPPPPIQNPMHNKRNLPALKTRPKLLLNSPLLPRSGHSVQAGRSLNSSSSSKSGWIYKGYQPPNQDPLDPPLHLPGNQGQLDHQPHRHQNLCLRQHLYLLNHIQRRDPPPLRCRWKHHPSGPSSPPVAAATTSPSSSPKKRQRSSSIDSSGDEVPKHQKKEKKEKPRHHSGHIICRVDEGVLDRHHRVQPQLIKDLRVLHNFKEVNGKNVEDPLNFPQAWVTSVIRKGRGSEGVIKMLGEANEALGPISFIKDDEHSCKGLIGRVPVVFHPSLYRAVKLTFPRDIGGLAHDGAITNEMATGSMSQTVGVLTPAMFSPGTQPL